MDIICEDCIFGVPLETLFCNIYNSVELHTAYELKGQLSTVWHYVLGVGVSEGYFG